MVMGIYGSIDLVDYVRSIISADMVILVKGSRGSGLDHVRALLEWC